MHDAHIAIAQSFREHARQSVVDLYRGDARSRFDECFGERAETGADLDNVITRAYLCETRNASHGVGIDDEVLTE
jgi:hypothetical protein